MGKYSEFLYGTEQYGEVQLTEGDYIWGLDIDWDGDGLFDGYNDAKKCLSLSLRRGRENQVKKNGDGFEPIKPGEIQFTLLNEDGKYDPFNTSSELYPYVRPGMKFRLRVRYLRGASGTVYNIMTGRIDDIRPNYGSDPATVTLTGVDSSYEMSQLKVPLAVQSNVAVEDAISTLLDEAEWDGSKKLENSPDTIPYWWAGEQSVYEEINSIAESSLGVAFVGASGSYNFYGRYHAVASGTVPVSLIETDIQRGVSLLMPWEVVRNDIRINVNSLDVADDVVIWTLNQSLSINGNSSVSFWVEWKYNNISVSAKDIIQPIAGTDYTANSNPNGGGTSMTSSISVSVTEYGKNAYVTVSNSSADVAHITLLQIRGDALSENDLIQEADEDTNSISIFGRREFNLDNVWIQNRNLARDHASNLADQLPSEIKYPTISIRNDPVKQFSSDLFDPFNLYFSSVGISGTYSLSYIEHQWLVPNGQATHTIMRFEPTLSYGTLWIFTTKIGTTSYFA